MKTADGLDTGWRFHDGVPIHYEPINQRDAERLIEVRERIFIVETIVTMSDETGELRRQRYFCYGMMDAISEAVRLEILSKMIAEEVVAIRPATGEEAALWVTRPMREGDSDA